MLKNAEQSEEGACPIAPHWPSSPCFPGWFGKQAPSSAVLVHICCPCSVLTFWSKPVFKTECALLIFNFPRTPPSLGMNHSSGPVLLPGSSRSNEGHGTTNYLASVGSSNVQDFTNTFMSVKTAQLLDKQKGLNFAFFSWHPILTHSTPVEGWCFTTFHTRTGLQYLGASLFYQSLINGYFGSF